jgi:hypothetical protein
MLELSDFRALSVVANVPFSTTDRAKPSRVRFHCANAYLAFYLQRQFLHLISLLFTYHAVTPWPFDFVEPTLD